MLVTRIATTSVVKDDKHPEGHIPSGMKDGAKPLAIRCLRDSIAMMGRIPCEMRGLEAKCHEHIPSGIHPQWDERMESQNIANASPAGHIPGGTMGHVPCGMRGLPLNCVALLLLLAVKFRCVVEFVGCQTVSCC